MNQPETIPAYHMKARASRVGRLGAHSDTQAANRALLTSQLRASSRKDREGSLAATDLSSIALARHVADALGDAARVGQHVVAEALAAELGAGDAIPGLQAVRNACARCHFARTDAGELHARCAQRPRVQLVGVAPYVRPARWQSHGYVGWERRRAGGRSSGGGCG